MEVKLMDKVQRAIPKIIFSEQAYHNMIKLYSAKITEVKEFMFIGVVEKITANDAKIYTIKDIKLIPQESNSGAYCETDDDRYPAWLHETFPTIEDKKKVRLNGHSHVNMAVNPSGVDNANIEKMMQYVDDYFIQLIINRRHEIKINLWDKESGLVYNNCSYFVKIDNAVVRFENSTTNTGSIVSIPDLKLEDFETTNDKYIFKNKNLYVDVLNNNTMIITKKLVFRHNKPIEAIVSDKEKKEIEKEFSQLLKQQPKTINSFAYYDDLFEQEDITYYGHYSTPKKKGGKK